MSKTTRNKDRGSKRVAANVTQESSRLFRIGLWFCLISALLIITEGILLALRSPLSWSTLIPFDWGGYVNLTFGVIIMVGFLTLAFLHERKKTKIAGEVLVGLFSIGSLILFGGGFYIGFILGVVGSLLTAAPD